MRHLQAFTHLEELGWAPSWGAGNRPGRKKVRKTARKRRILGDERNYAGTSFVTPEMFGSYQYGSELLNIVYDPTRAEQFATYGWDDDGCPAKKEYVIRGGILQRPLGGLSSQARAGMRGVANSRASSWNRPPIDRMANLNLEVGTSKLDEMIAAVKHGVYMKTNCSWSIDDSRNKFQFGCEWGRLIEDGRLTTVVKNPNYRGISATFWRNLKMVGDSSTHEVMGTPFCGKGEPNQIIEWGTPARRACSRTWKSLAAFEHCLFSIAHCLLNRRRGRSRRDRSPAARHEVRAELTIDD